MDPNTPRELQLFAIGRIPRCRVCPRYRALLVNEEVEASRARRPLPAAPPSCGYLVCLPLVARYERVTSEQAAGPTRIAVGRV